MAVKCEEVWREISNYLEGDVDPGLRAAVEGHVRSCQRCSAVVNGTRNIVQLYGDERMLEVPLGFSYRLQRRVNENLVGSRRGFLGWMVAAAAAVVVSGAVEVSRSAVFGQPELRSK
jgi:anti-sigma factor RsiW